MRYFFYQQSLFLSNLISSLNGTFLWLKKLNPLRLFRIKSKTKQNVNKYNEVWFRTAIRLKKSRKTTLKFVLKFKPYNFKNFRERGTFSVFKNFANVNFAHNFNQNKIFNFFNNKFFIFSKNFFLIKKINVLYFLLYKNTIGDGYYYLRGLLTIFFIDACVTDDEPLWEPIEWSLLQTWILFIFIFAWIAENLITSRFGSYTGRDKRIWFAWYKTFWLIDLSYIVSYGLAALLVIVPFYYELTYNLSFVISWWNWYSKSFFFRFISMYSLMITVSTLLLLNLRWLNWKKLIIIILLINFFLAYLLYVHFIMSFFGYFTNPLWYQRVRPVDYVQLSHEPLKWGWGGANRDHFPYHKVSTVFWFKNDGPFAGAFLMLHLFLFLTIFFLYIYWLVLLRRVYTTKEVTFTFTTFCVSALKQFFYFFLLIYILVFMSFIVAYWRFPIEFIWMINSYSWVNHFFVILKDYTVFVINLFFNF